MNIQRQSIAIYPTTLSWVGKLLVDWTNAGAAYSLDGQQLQLASYHWSYHFDRAITSADGRYAFIYHNLGTKGLLLKDGELLREISRSYYQADVYEYPATFVTVSGVTYLIHCPISYRQLDFEEVETGVLITNIAGREPGDFFHSRLEVNPAGTFLLSKGWFWHPFDMVEAFDIAACLTNPLLLDNTALSPLVGTEVCTAGFITNELVLLGSSNEESMNDELTDALPPESIVFWNVSTGELSAPVRVAGKFGNLFPLNKKLAWDLYEYPKLLDLATGAVVASLPELTTSEQRSSIIGSPVPAIIFDHSTGYIAIKTESAVEVLSVIM